MGSSATSSPLAIDMEQRRRPSRRSSMPFSKGQQVFYRSSKGISKVTIVDIHKDSKSGHRFVVKLRDGSEEQAYAKHLTPVQDVLKSSFTSVSSCSSKTIVSRSLTSTMMGSVDMSEVLSETEEDNFIEKRALELEDEQNLRVRNTATCYRETKHIFGQEEKTHQGNNTAPVRQGSIESLDEPCTFAPRTRHGSMASLDETCTSLNGSEDKRFSEARDAYYRSPGGGISKVRIISQGSDPRHPDRYKVSFPDGSYRENVDPSLLVTLVDMTGKDLCDMRRGGNKLKHSSSRKAVMEARPSCHGKHLHTPVEDSIENPDHTNESCSKVISGKFSVGDEVLYTSSQGEHLSAIVARLKIDSKNRTYYMLQLSHGGKEKAVYGHRLQHCSCQDNPNAKDKPRSFRRRLSQSMCSIGRRGSGLGLAGLRSSFKLRNSFCDMDDEPPMSTAVAGSPKADSLVADQTGWEKALESSLGGRFGQVDKEPAGVYAPKNTHQHHADAASLVLLK